jgi:hypothetical protein
MIVLLGQLLYALLEERNKQLTAFAAIVTTF